MHEGLPKSILVGTDLSDSARQALHRAADVALACSAKLTVVYANDFTSPIESTENLTARVEQSKNAARKQLQNEVQEVVPPNVAVDTLLIDDAPVPAILNTAKEKNVDWIVVGTHGWTGMGRMIVGSVAEEVVRQADRPVLTVQSHA